MFSMTIALLLGAGAPPGEAAIRAAAMQCNLPSPWLRVGRDGDGAYADLFPGPISHPIDGAIACLTRWAGATGARFAFANEPPPGPRTFAIVPTASTREAQGAALNCALPIRVDPLDGAQARVVVRRYAIAGPLACMADWLRAHGLGPGGAR